jgi:UDP-glucose 4-epimerase
MKVLVVGGAGYIGSHMARLLAGRGAEVVVFDNLFRGHHAAVGPADFVRGDLLDREELGRLFKEHAFDGVFHFAALACVGESVEEPGMYWRNNVSGTLNLLEAMAGAGVKRIIFSSSAAVYGEPEEIPIVEDHLTRPINPYGWTKLTVERMLDDFSQAHGLRYGALRYFNAAGATEDGSIGEDHEPETHLVPIVLQCALGKRGNVGIFGTDYRTPDGTCVRDYIHVDDLAEAHVIAYEALDKGNLTLNLGNGSGYSVREVIECARNITGKPISAIDAPRREGDPPVLVASSERAKRELEWKPRYPDLKDIIRTAWKWHQSHPDGYANNS